MKILPRRRLEMGAYRRKGSKVSDDIIEIFEHLSPLGQRKNQMASRFSGGERRMLEQFPED